MSNENKLRFWCQTVLPLVYDDSLSYYELLNKVVKYLNSTIEDVADTQEDLETQKHRITTLEREIDNLTIDAFVYRGNLLGDFPVGEELNNGLYTLHIAEGSTGWPDGLAQNGLLFVEKTTQGSRDMAFLITDRGRSYYNEYLYGASPYWRGWREDSRFNSLANDIAGVNTTIANLSEECLKKRGNLTGAFPSGDIQDGIYTVVDPTTGWGDISGSDAILIKTSTAANSRGFVLVLDELGNIYWRARANDTWGAWASRNTESARFINATLASGVTLASGGRCGYRTDGLTAWIDCNLSFTMPSSATTVASNFPPPATTQYFYFTVSGATIGQARLTDSGNLQVTWARNLADGSNAAGTNFAWARFQLCYMYNY